MGLLFVLYIRLRDDLCRIKIEIRYNNIKVILEEYKLIKFH